MIMSMAQFELSVGWILRVFLISKSGYFEDQKKMENISDRIAPMHKKLIEHMSDNIMIQSFLKLLGENVIILVQHRQHLNKCKSYHLHQNRIIRLQNTSNTCIEVVVIEIVRDLFTIV